MRYNPVTLVHIALDNGETKQQVGRLALKDRRIYFEYDSEFLKTELQLSPFKLPLQARAISCDDNIFEGLFGLFNDSLPDGWGRLLLDRQIRKHGIASELLTPLDRLSHVGARGMGALTYEPDMSDSKKINDILNLDLLAKESRLVLEGESDKVFEELLQLSGSSAGARPKIMVGVDKKRKTIISGLDSLPANYEYWMIKFASSHDREDVGAIEYAYSLMAEAAGVQMMPTHLFSVKKGKGYFGVKRFDREINSRTHIHSASGLLHSSHRLPTLDYEQLLRATLALTANIKEVEKIFRQAAFNVFSHNRDDHSKNFSFLMKPNKSWIVAPAYDLTFSNGPGGEHSTTVMGEGRAPTVKHLKKLSEKFSISEKITKNILDEVRASVSQWSKWAEQAGVTKASKLQIEKVLVSL